MKHLDGKSLASVLKGVLALVWLGLILGIVFVIGLVLWSFVNGELVGSDKVVISAQGLAFFIPVTDTLAFAVFRRVDLVITVLPLMVVSLFITHQLRCLLSTLSTHPFATENVVRIRRIGYAFIAFGFFNSLASFMTGWYLLPLLSVPSVEVQARFSLYPSVLIAGAIIILLGQVFGHGTNLQDDHDLTI